MLPTSIAEKKQQVSQSVEQFAEKERTNSRISPEIWTANTQIVSPDDTDWETGLPLAYTLVNAQGSRFHISSRNGIDAKNSHLRAGGIWFLGYKLNASWGIFKPISPRIDPEKGEPRKYESVAGGGLGLYLPRLAGAEGDILTPYRQAAAAKSPLIITEGAKKALSLASAGFFAIGLQGCNGGYEKGNGKRILRPELAQILSLGWDEVYIALDQDPSAKPKAVKNVNAAKKNLAALIKEATGKAPLFLSWKGNEKGIDDYIAAGGDVSLLIEGASRSPFNSFKEWLSRHSIPSKYSVTRVTCDPYLPKIALPKQRLVALKAPKGSGKTEILKHWNDELTEGGIVPISLTHRVQLGEALAERLGIAFNNSMTDDQRRVIYHTGFEACIDSLIVDSRLSFNRRDWEDRSFHLILDEVEQLIAHLLTASTLKGKRPAILENFIWLLSRAEKILIADADLSGVALDCITALANIPPSEVVIIEGEGPKDSTGKKVLKFSHPEDLFAEVVYRIENDQKGIFFTGGQKVNSTYSAQNIAARLQGLFPKKKILYLDSETVADPTHPSFGIISDGGKAFAAYDVVVASPVLETGIDLNPKKLGLHWDFVAGISYGVQSPTSFCQALARYRGVCDRLIYCPDSTPCGMELGGSFFPSDIKCTIGDFSESSGIEAATYFGASMVTFAHIIARGNLGRNCYGDAVLHLLEEDGYIPVFPRSRLSEEERPSWVKAAKENKKKRTDEYCQKVSETNIEAISAKDLRALEDKKNKTKEERMQLAKHQSIKKFGAAQPDHIDALLDGAYAAFWLRFWAIRGECPPPPPPKENGEMVWLPDDVGHVKTRLRLEALKAFKILELVTEGEQFSADDPRIAALGGEDKNRSVEKIFGSWGGNNPVIGRLRVILESIGLSLKSHRVRCGESAGKKKSRKKMDVIKRLSGEGRKYLYSIVPKYDLEATAPDEVLAIFTHFEKIAPAVAAGESVPSFLPPPITQIDGTAGTLSESGIQEVSHHSLYKKFIIGGHKTLDAETIEVIARLEREKAALASSLASSALAEVATVVMARTGETITLPISPSVPPAVVETGESVPSFLPPPITRIDGTAKTLSESGIQEVSHHSLYKELFTGNEALPTPSASAAPVMVESVPSVPPAVAAGESERSVPLGASKLPPRPILQKGERCYTASGAGEVIELLSGMGEWLVRVAFSFGALTLPLSQLEFDF